MYIRKEYRKKEEEKRDDEEGGRENEDFNFVRWFTSMDELYRISNVEFESVSGIFLFGKAFK